MHLHPRMIKFFATLYSCSNRTGSILLPLQVVLFSAGVQFNIYFVGALIAGRCVYRAGGPVYGLQTLREVAHRGTTPGPAKRAFDSIPKFIWYALTVPLVYMAGVHLSKR